MEWTPTSQSCSSCCISVPWSASSWFLSVWSMPQLEETLLAWMRTLSETSEDPAFSVPSLPINLMAHPLPSAAQLIHLSTWMEWVRMAKLSPVLVWFQVILQSRTTAVPLQSLMLQIMIALHTSSLTHFWLLWEPSAKVWLPVRFQTSAIMLVTLQMLQRAAKWIPHKSSSRWPAWSLRIKSLQDSKKDLPLLAVLYSSLFSLSTSLISWRSAKRTTTLSGILKPSLLVTILSSSISLHPSSKSIVSRSWEWRRANA